MDNQHKHIKGYRDLSTEEIALMNEAKELAAKVGAFIEQLEGVHRPLVDGRWMSIAKTDLQKGFMVLVRSIAQPTTF